MITIKEAIESVRADLDDEMDVIVDSILEKEYGWVIYSQTKKYIETGSISHMAVGSGGVLVEKPTGRKIQFGSAYPTDKNLEIYEKGYFKYENWDVVVTRVNNLRRTINFLDNLDITYVEPEEAHGTVWKIPQKFTHKQFKSKLSKLPVRFSIGKVYFQYDTLESLKQQNDFIYSLEGNRGFVNGI